MGNKAIRSLLLAMIFLCGFLILLNYWSSFTLAELKFIPNNALILIVVYLGLQLLNRRLFARQNWWNWLYYIGLIAIVMSYFFVTQELLGFFLFLVKFGTVFLIVPPIIDFFQLMNAEKI